MSRTDRIVFAEEDDYTDLPVEGPVGQDIAESYAATYRLADAKGSMWLDVKLPELPRFDEFVCVRCNLVTHVSRGLAAVVCVECA